MMTAFTGRSPRCFSTRAIAARVHSTLMSVSMTIQPVWPSISVRFAMSYPRTW